MHIPECKFLFINVTEKETEHQEEHEYQKKGQCEANKIAICEIREKTRFEEMFNIAREGQNSQNPILKNICGNIYLSSLFTFIYS